MQNQPTPPPAPKSSNQKLWLGIVIGSLLMVIITLTWEVFLPIIIPYLMCVTIIVIVPIVVGGLGLYFYWNRLMKKWFGREIDVHNVIEDLQHGVQTISAKLVDTALIGMEKEKKEEIKWLMPRFINYVLFSQIRNWGLRFSITILATLGGLLGTILLFNQNQLLTKQNEKIDNQILLDEASRRSSLNFLMANVLDKIDEELKNPKNKKRTLSLELIGRIASLSQSFQPYRFMDGDTMIAKPLSPERGNLLLALVNSNLDTLTLDTIFSRTIFRRAYLRGAILNNTYLKNADFYEADFYRVYLYGADLSGADLRGTGFSGAIMDGTDLSGADLKGASFNGAILNGADFSYADLSVADLSVAELIGADLSGADLSGADFSGAFLNEAILNEAYLNGASFSGAYLSEADLSGAILSGADLFGIKGITVEQLKSVYTLYEAKNIPDSILIKLKKSKPELFDDPHSW